MRAVRLAQEMQTKTSKVRDKPALDPDLRLYIYRYFIRHGRAPSAAEMANGLSRPLKQVRAAFGAPQRHARICPAGEWGIVAGGAIFCRSYGLSGQDRPAFVVRQLYLGRAWYCCDAAPGRQHRHFLRLLQLRNGFEGQERPAITTRRGCALCSPCPRLVQRHRLHMKNHAPVPVGTAR